MNERIRTLVRQAGLDDADFPIEDWDNVPLAKFAQLIITECVDVYDHWAEHSMDKSAFVVAKTHVNKHFGVEKLNIV